MPLAAPQRDTPLLQARGLRLATGARVDLRVGGGEIHALSGPSGGGKTLLLRALADLDPVQGERALDGQDGRQMPAWQWRAEVMLVPAQARWWLGSIRAHLASEVSAQAEQLGLGSDRLNAPVEQLSAGESARGALLRALSRRPRVLLLDEPTGALDPATAARAETLVRDWVDTRRAVIWVSHEPAQIERVADHHWVLDRQGLRAA